MEEGEDKEKKEEEEKESSGEDEERKKDEEVSEGEGIEEAKDETKEEGSSREEKKEIEIPEKIAEDGEEKETTEEVAEKTSEESKQLKKVFVVMGILAVFFIGIFLFINSARQFTYNGVDFEVDKQTMTGHILYRTSLPVNSEHKVTGGAVFANYNFYLKNDPRKLKNLPLEGELTLMENVVMNFTGDFKCGGKGIIAVADLMGVLDVLDVNVVTNDKQGCDPNGQYTFLNLQTANETSIEQFGPSCYNLNINNCEVLEVTEKYIVELLSEIHKNRL